jgi:hypothetical protein
LRKAARRRDDRESNRYLLGTAALAVPIWLLLRLTSLGAFPAFVIASMLAGGGLALLSEVSDVVREFLQVGRSRRAESLRRAGDPEDRENAG